MLFVISYNQGFAIGTAGTMYEKVRNGESTHWVDSTNTV